MLPMERLKLNRYSHAMAKIRDDPVVIGGIKGMHYDDGYLN